jgi:hypothetical protein
MKTKTNKLGAIVGVIVGLVVLMSGQAGAYELLGIKWPGSHPRVPIYVSTSLQGSVPYDGTFEEGVQAIQRAAQTWNGQGESNFGFTYAGLTEVSEVADDGVNAIIYSDSPCPVDSGCGAITHYHETNGVYHGFDIVLFGNSGGDTGWDIVWSVKEIPDPWDADLESVILHELGHGLGLDHGYPGSVMGTGCGTGCKNTSLGNDDLNGIQALYGAYQGEGFEANIVTAQPGDTITLTLDYPKAKRRNYQVFMSQTGMEGTPLYLTEPTDSRILAINDDFFPTENYPEIFQSFSGRTSREGEATATVTIPQDPSLLGSDLYFTAVTENCSYLNCYEDVGVGVHVVIAGADNTEPTPTPTPTPEPTPEPTPTPTPEATPTPSPTPTPDPNCRGYHCN